MKSTHSKVEMSMYVLEGRLGDLSFFLFPSDLFRSLSTLIVAGSRGGGREGVSSSEQGSRLCKEKVVSMESLR